MNVIKRLENIIKIFIHNERNKKVIEVAYSITCTPYIRIYIYIYIYMIMGYYILVKFPIHTATAPLVHMI